jgi:hypothetical protein
MAGLPLGAQRISAFGELDPIDADRGDALEHEDREHDRAGNHRRP